MRISKKTSQKLTSRETSFGNPLFKRNHNSEDITKTIDQLKYSVPIIGERVDEIFIRVSETAKIQQSRDLSKLEGVRELVVHVKKCEAGILLARAADSRLRDEVYGETIVKLHKKSRRINGFSNAFTGPKGSGKTECSKDVSV